MVLNVTATNPSAATFVSAYPYGTQRTDASNLNVAAGQTGYCPGVSSWPAVAEALDRIGIDRPSGFTHEVIFRRCQRVLFAP
ncbi:hypothetical protein ABZZ44_18050 [Streptomyces sp. NPDC006460]|uniref:hypothetical protein n=1 Tax=Streptomyces sp. NPDC006460 TaxID=3154304 RepID=UPI0033BF51DE